jgi:acyl-CoA dehydrogenase
MATLPSEVLGVPRPDWMEDDVAMLEDMASRWLEAEVVPHYDRYEKQEMVDRSAWEGAGAAGLLCASMPEEYGGSGGTYAHEAAIIEALGAQAPTGSASRCTMPSSRPTSCISARKSRSRNGCRRWRRARLIGAIAMTEPGAGSDLQGIKTTAKKDGNHYVINGSKTFITNGQHANLIIVVTKTDPAKGAKGTSLMVVETDEVEGFRRGRNLDKVGLKINDTSELFFDDVRVFPPQTCSARKKARALPS